jgi:hypothetical protein
MIGTTVYSLFNHYENALQTKPSAYYSINNPEKSLKIIIKNLKQIKS